MQQGSSSSTMSGTKDTQTSNGVPGTTLEAAKTSLDAPETARAQSAPAAAAPKASKAAPMLPPRNTARTAKAASSSTNSNAAPQLASSTTTTSPASSNNSKSTLARPSSTGKLNAVNVSGGSVKAMPSLPARGSSGSGSAVVGVIDPEEPEATQQLRAKVHDIRVRLIRAARRLGYEHDNGLVKQVLYRLYLAEKLKEPFRKGSRRPDSALLAARDADKLEAEQGPNSPLNLNVKILVIGLRGTGKTQLVRSLLGISSNSSSSSSTCGSDPSSSSSSSNHNNADRLPLDAFTGQTKRVEVTTGQVLGITLTMIDTPGLTASAAGTAANAAVLRKVKTAFKQHAPDLVLYVDRFDQPTRAGGEVSVLQAVTNACGPHIWLNTIVALTHAGAMPPASGQGHMSWDAYSQQRSQLLQLIIRSASGDARLMNPIAFAESHPACRRNAQGQAVIPSGMAWQQHMLVLIVSAKLLADAEAALQMTPDSAAAGHKLGSGPGAGLDAASMRQLMGRPDGPPVRYLMTQLTSFSQPLTYPDHGSVMELRNAKKQLRSLKGWRDRKELNRQIRFRLLQMQQMNRRQQRTTDLLCKATRAGGKLQLAQPRTATRVRPSVQPPVGHRYRALEPGAGWIVRPHIEPHGMDNADNVEGFMAEKAGVWRSAISSGSSSPDQLLMGMPFRISTSASASKEQLLMQTRGEMSVYHSLPGLATTTLSADLQTSGAAGPAAPDMLVVMRVDSQRRGFPIAANNPSAGLMLARLAQECRPHRGPMATGVRVQDCIRMTGPGGAPVELDMALGKLFCRPGLEPDDAWGANAELRTDASRLLGSRYSAPLSLSGSIMGHRNETMSAVSAAMQVQRSRRSGIGGKLQINSRGVATLGLQVRSDGAQWWGLVGLMPLFNLGWDMVASALGGGRGGEEYEQQQAGEEQQAPATQ